MCTPSTGLKLCLEILVNLGVLCRFHFEGHALDCLDHLLIIADIAAQRDEDVSGAAVTGGPQAYITSTCAPSPLPRCMPTPLLGQDRYRRQLQS